LSLVRYRTNDYSVPTEYGHRQVLVRTTQAADYMVLLPCPPAGTPHLDVEVAL
jgi:hypothetical protein